MRRRSLFHAAFAASLAAALPTRAAMREDASPGVTDRRMPDVGFVPTPYAVVDSMLELARIGPDDLLYDLGSGDGRIPITAARRFGTRGVGIDIDPQRVAEARANARDEGVADRVVFRQADIFELPLDELRRATAISLYLLSSLNLKLRPTLLQLEPGTRIVSHAFDMGDWTPDRELEVLGRRVYLWTVPSRGR